MNSYSEMWLWAKLGKETWPEEYHPVVCHLLDVAAVTLNLWDRVIRSRLRLWVSDSLGLDEQACGRLLAFWSGAHDIGKVSPCFQDRGRNNTVALRDQLGAAWFTSTVGNEHHGTLTTKILAEELAHATQWPAVDSHLASYVAVAVGGHHGILPTNWAAISGPLGNDRWAAARRALLAELARLCGVNDLQAPSLTHSDDQAVWMYVAGLTSVADWIGSNQEFFKPAGNAALLDGPFDLDDYFKKAKGWAVEALEKLGWLGRADASSEIAITDYLPKGRKPRPLQRTVAEIVERISEPSLLIVEAPMGEGKTEAGWYAAACWERRGGQGAYVALPTMATSNQMFDRVGLFLGTNAGKKNLILQHGKAALNDQFEKLKYAARVYDDESKPSAVVAEGWFAANKKHGLLAPYGVGTIDQALLAVLQTKHVFVRLFGLAGKCVILDEVHAYDTYMTTLIERLLRWLATLRCPVVLLSATLPRDKRIKLLRAYAGEDVEEPEHVGYPRVTSAPVGGPVDVKHIEADSSRRETVGLGWVDEDDLVEKLRQSLANGGCAAVIRNTVGLAQETYLRVRDGFEDDGITIHLFHARFPFGRRKRIEDDILKWYGRTAEDVVNDEGRIESAPHRPAKSVLVATQVVEQSLDLDFDVIVSDVAPVDLVLQRSGRLHRHDRGVRPLGVKEPWLWLINPKVQSGAPDFGVTGIVYSPFILFRSMLSLRSVGTAKRDSLPAQIDTLVDQVYQDLPVPDSLSSAERDFWEKTHAKHIETIGKEESEAESRQIKKPQYRGGLARVVQEPREEENPDLHPAHQALTRLTRPTALLICLEREANGSYRLPHDNTPVPTLAIRKMSEGGSADVGRLMLGEIASAHPGVINQLRAEPRIPPEWVEVGMLCRHHLIPFSNGRARLGEYELSLDNFLGLTITRTGDHGEDE